MSAKKIYSLRTDLIEHVATNKSGLRTRGLLEELVAMYDLEATRGGLRIELDENSLISDIEIAHERI